MHVFVLLCYLPQSSRIFFLIFLDSVPQHCHLSNQAQVLTNSLVLDTICDNMKRKITFVTTKMLQFYVPLHVYVSIKIMYLMYVLWCERQSFRRHTVSMRASLFSLYIYNSQMKEVNTSPQVFGWGPFSPR